MRSVLFAAAAATCLAFAAHGAEAPATSPSLPAAPATGTICMDSGSPGTTGATLTTDDDADCCDASNYCAQYLSTQMLVQGPQGGHT